ERDAGEERGRLPVAAVAQHGVADLGEVDADLMLAARLQSHTHERRVLEPLDDGEVRDRALARPTDGGRVHREALRVLHEPGLDRAALAREAAGDDGRVDAARFARFELRSHPLHSAGGPREGEQPGCVLIEPVDDEELRLLDAARAQGSRDELGEALVAAPGRGRREKAGGLVDDDDLRVLVDDAEAGAVTRLRAGLVAPPG